MTNELLRAAKRLRSAMGKHTKDAILLPADVAVAMEDVVAAIASAGASQPAPSEEQIEAWLQDATDSRMPGLQTQDGHAVYQVGGDTIKRAVAMMRRAAAAPQPAKPEPVADDVIEAAIDDLWHSTMQFANASVEHRGAWEARVVVAKNYLRALIARRVAEAEARGATVRKWHGRLVQHDHSPGATYSNCIGCIADERDRVEKERDEARAEVERLRAELAAAKEGE